MRLSVYLILSAIVTILSLSKSAFAQPASGTSSKCIAAIHCSVLTREKYCELDIRFDKPHSGEYQYFYNGYPAVSEVIKVGANRTLRNLRFGYYPLDKELDVYVRSMTTKKILCQGGWRTDYLDTFPRDDDERRQNDEEELERHKNLPPLRIYVTYLKRIYDDSVFWIKTDVIFNKVSKYIVDPTPTKGELRFIVSKNMEYDFTGKFCKVGQLLQSNVDHPDLIIASTSGPFGQYRPEKGWKAVGCVVRVEKDDKEPDKVKVLSVIAQPQVVDYHSSETYQTRQSP